MENPKDYQKYPHIYINKVAGYTVYKNTWRNQVWWCTPVIPALRRLRQEDHELKASLNYIMSFCLKKKSIAFL
jgi:hypothetical protein